MVIEMYKIIKKAIKYLPNELESAGGIISMASTLFGGLSIGDFYNVAFGAYFLKSGLTNPPELPIFDNHPFYQAVRTGLNEAITAKGIVVAGNIAMSIYLISNQTPADGSITFAVGAALSEVGSLVRKHRLKKLENSLSE
jgi:hypothetical protein